MVEVYGFVGGLVIIFIGAVAYEMWSRCRRSS